MLYLQSRDRVRNSQMGGAVLASSWNAKIYFGTPLRHPAMSTLPLVHIFEEELDFISDCVLQYPEQETGGDFFGFWSREGNPVIHYVLGPGRQTTRSAVSFFQDIEYLKRCGSILSQNFGLEHIGAWHSHHKMNLLAPSSGDVHTMRNALNERSLTRFLISICNVTSVSSISLGYFLFVHNLRNDYLDCNVRVFPGKSPVRESLSLTRSLDLPFEQFADRRDSPRKRAQRGFTIRQPDAIQGYKSELIEKPEFVEGSFWSKREGHLYLKRIYDNLNAIRDLSAVNIKQLSDDRPAISFDYHGATYEIRFPLNFPREEPHVITSNLVSQSRDFPWSSIGKNRVNVRRLEEVTRIINSLELVEGGGSITIHEAR